jgi:hypothetical protein
MFYLGGTVQGANIEVHDVQFAAAERPESAYKKLAANWYGESKFLHVDVEARINWVDGYDVSIGSRRAEGDLGLFFVHMGGYVPGHLDEKHSYDLFVAANKAEARTKALAAFRNGKLLPHKDVLFDVDSVVQIDSVDGMQVQLLANPDGKAEAPQYRYTPIGSNTSKWDEATDEMLENDGNEVDDVRTPSSRASSK